MKLTVIPLYQDDEDFDSVRILEQEEKKSIIELIKLNDKNEICFCFQTRQ